MTNWKYTDKSERAVMRILPDGSTESCCVSVIADWIATGGVPDPADPITFDPDSGVKVIDSLQGQLWIYRAGHYDAFTAFLSSLTIEQSIIAKAMMHADAKWKSNNPLIVGFLGGMLGMDAAAIGSVFDAASEINPWAVA